MNIGQKAFAFALGAFFVVGIAAVATAATGAPDTGESFELDTSEVEAFEIEVVDESDEGIEFNLSESEEYDHVEIEAEKVDDPAEMSMYDDREDSYDGDADYYHVPVGAVDDVVDSYDELDLDYELDAVEFAGMKGYVVEADEVDSDDPRVVAHVAENDPEIDGITRADELKTAKIDGSSVNASELETDESFEFELEEEIDLESDE